MVWLDCLDRLVRNFLDWHSRNNSWWFGWTTKKKQTKKLVLLRNATIKAQVWWDKKKTMLHFRLHWQVLEVVKILIWDSTPSLERMKKTTDEIQLRTLNLTNCAFPFLTTLAHSDPFLRRTMIRHAAGGRVIGVIIQAGFGLEQVHFSQILCRWLI